MGWTTFMAGTTARLLRDMQWSAEVETMDLTLFTGYVALCAANLARAHARMSEPTQSSS
ncbi:MAG TPA: DUF2252 family protein [Ktedonobacteraceae bacterium]